MLLSTKRPPLSHTFLSQFQEVDAPLVHFAKMFTRAYILKSLPTMTYLHEQYKPLIELDQEIKNFTEHFEKVVSTPVGSGGFGQMMQQMMGQLMGGGH